MLLVVVATVAQLTWAASPSASCDAVVSFAHGADVSSGGSADHPFKSIAFALSKNPAGRICLRGSEVNIATLSSRMAIRWWWELMWCEKRLCVCWRHGNVAWHAYARCAGLKNMCRRCQTRNGVSQRSLHSDVHNLVTGAAPLLSPEYEPLHLALCGAVLVSCGFLHAVSTLRGSGR